MEEIVKGNPGKKKKHIIKNLKGLRYKVGLKTSYRVK